MACLGSCLSDQHQPCWNQHQIRIMDTTLNIHSALFRTLSYFVHSWRNLHQLFTLTHCYAVVCRFLQHMTFKLYFFTFSFLYFKINLYRTSALASLVLVLPHLVFSQWQQIQLKNLGKIKYQRLCNFWLNRNKELFSFQCCH